MESRHTHFDNARMAALALLLAVSSGTCQAQAEDEQPICGSLANTFGPFDYRTAGKGNLHLVESFHYGPQVDSLIRGMTGELGADIAYTLTVFPNHHRALLAMMRLGERQHLPMPRGAVYTVECYFERALRWRNDDTIARMIYATYLIHQDREKDARAQLEESRRIGADNPFTQYNVGLIYFDIKDYDKALAQAHTASAMGFAPPALKDKLKAIGKWKEPDPAQAAAVASGASAPAAATSVPPAIAASAAALPALSAASVPR